MIKALNIGNFYVSPEHYVSMASCPTACVRFGLSTESDKGTIEYEISEFNEEAERNKLPFKVDFLQKNDVFLVLGKVKFKRWIKELKKGCGHSYFISILQGQWKNSILLKKSYKSFDHFLEALGPRHVLSTKTGKTGWIFFENPLNFDEVR